MGTEWKRFWADLRRDYASLWPEFRNGLREAREQWRETAAEVRQGRQLDRRMRQRITGTASPTRRQWREVSRAILGEVREIEAAERRVLREFRDRRGREPE